MYTKIRILTVVSSTVILLNCLIILLSYPLPHSVRAETGGPKLDEGSFENIIGNWVIEDTDNRYYGNRTINIAGDLFIYGELTLQNVTLCFNSTFDGQYGIYVEKGGSLVIRDNDRDKNSTEDACDIMAVNSDSSFFFQVKEESDFKMENSRLRHCGYEFGTYGKNAGLWINADQSVLLGNNITQCRSGILLSNVSDCVVKGNDINNCYGKEGADGGFSGQGGDGGTCYGIYTYNTERCLITDNNMIDLHGGNGGGGNRGGDGGDCFGIHDSFSRYSIIERNIVRDIYKGTGGMSNDHWIKNGFDGSSIGINFYNTTDLSIDNNICNSISHYGIKILNSNNTVISRNTCNTNDQDGIYLYRCNNSKLTYNTCNSNRRSGIYLYMSDAEISNNTCISNDEGIYLASSDNNVVIDNKFNKNTNGIYVDSSKKNKIFRNVCDENDNGVLMSWSHEINVTNNSVKFNEAKGIVLSDSLFITVLENDLEKNGLYLHSNEPGNWNTHNISTSNSADGKPIIYLKNTDGHTVDYQAGQIIIANCKNIVIENQEFNNTYSSILVGYSDFNIISNNICENNHNSICLTHSNNNSINNNTITHSNDHGLIIGHSEFNIVKDNTFNNNKYGVSLSGYSENNDIHDNAFNDNDYGISLGNSDGNNIYCNTMNDNNHGGIYLYSSDRNTLKNNICSNNEIGIYLKDDCDNNNITDNVCNGNIEGIYLNDSCYDNNIYNNTCNGNNEGIYVFYKCEDNNIYDNTCENNEYGIFLEYSNKNNVKYNTCSNNLLGIRLLASYSGNNIENNKCFSNNYSIYIVNSHYNLICKNVCFDNQYGLYLSTSDNNNIQSNTYSRNSCGMQLYYSSDNFITNNIFYNNSDFEINISDSGSKNNNVHHNTFMNNKKNGIQAHDAGMDNIWDNSYDNGNYWSDYSLRYPSGANDGSVWNIPYEINGSSISKDNYPLCKAPLEKTILILESDNTPTTPTTGDEFVFNVNIMDCYFVACVKIFYSYDRINYFNLTMVNLSFNTWEKRIIISNNETSLCYYFYAEDTFGNCLIGPRKQLQIIDDEKPVFLMDIADNNATTGDNFSLAAYFRDNIHVSKAFINYTFDGIKYFTKSMSFIGLEMWNTVIEIFSDAIQLEWYFYFQDKWGNNNITSTRTTVVQDNDAPISYPGNNLRVELGISVVLNGTGSEDNIGIVNYTWSFQYNNSNIILYSSTPSYVFAIPGNYTIILRVQDEAGNEANDSLNITVIETEIPGNDTLPDDDDEDDDIEDNYNITKSETNATDDLEHDEGYTIILICLITIILAVLIAILYLKRRREKSHINADTSPDPDTSVSSWGKVFLEDSSQFRDDVPITGESFGTEDNDSSLIDWDN